MFKLWQQIKIYKNLLIVFWAINIFSVVTASVIAFYYFNTPHNEFSELSRNKLTLGESLSRISKLNSNSKANEIFLINKEISNYNWAPTYTLPLSKKKLLDKKPELLKRLIDDINESESDSQRLYEANSKKQKQLIIIGVVTLIFGLFLPLAILVLMSKLGFLAKRKTEDHIKDWILQWQKEHSNYDEAYKSPEFWSRILIISVEHFSPLIDHPAASYIGEVSGEIKKEMLKNSVNPKSYESDTDRKEAA